MNDRINVLCKKCLVEKIPRSTSLFLTKKLNIVMGEELNSLKHDNFMKKNTCNACNGE